MKTLYISPRTRLITLTPEHIIATSPVTADTSNVKTESDVTFESEARSWSSDSWASADDE